MLKRLWTPAISKPSQHVPRNLAAEITRQPGWLGAYIFASKGSTRITWHKDIAPSSPPSLKQTKHPILTQNDQYTSRYSADWSVANSKCKNGIVFNVSLWMIDRPTSESVQAAKVAHRRVIAEEKAEWNNADYWGRKQMWSKHCLKGSLRKANIIVVRDWDADQIKIFGLARVNVHKSCLERTRRELMRER